MRLVERAMGAIIASALGASAVAGNLNPPAGPVAPSLKTLDEVEPRVPVNALAGDADSVHLIDQPGSYYLTADVQGEMGKHGIEVTADGVTIDLRGFSLSGVDGSLDGITLDGGISNVHIHGGSIIGFDETGIDGLFDGSGSLYENLTLRGNNQGGISAFRSVVRGCVAENSGIGFRVNESVIAGCVVNSAGIGIDASSGSRVVDCTVRFGSTGLQLSSGSLATGNVLENSFAEGIYADDFCSIEHNLVCGDNGDGIVLGGTGTVVANNVVACAASIGIDADSFLPSDCLIIANRVSSLIQDPVLVGIGNAFGPIINVGGAGDLSFVPDAEHPQANLVY